MACASVAVAGAELSGNDNPSVLTITLWGVVGCLGLVSGFVDYRRNNQLPGAGALASFCQLPADINDLTGRTSQVVQLQNLLRAKASPQPSLVAIGGKGGVGKTTLAVHVAHRLRPHYSDGQLYANLRGVGSHAVKPAEILGDFLRVLGVDGATIPDSIGERSGLFRSVTADRKILVVLDNAVDESQVRPLLPGAPTCGIMVTSRRHLAGLEGAVHIPLEILDAKSSVELLARIVGQDRVNAEPAAAAELADLCGKLPLALRIIGAKIAMKPHWSLREIADQLGDERERLRELRMGDLDVRASFELSYAEMDHTQRQAFGLLGLLRTREFGTWVLAPLMEISQAESRRVLEQLVDSQLVEVLGRDQTGQLRYELHDLIHLYAKEIAGRFSRGEQNAAVARLGGAYLALAASAEAQFQPGEVRIIGKAKRWPAEVEYTDPVTWFTVERRSLLLMIEDLFERELWSLTWELSHALGGFFELLAHWDDWKVANTRALAAARAEGSVLGRSAVLFDSGALNRDLGRLNDATSDFSGALAGFREIGDQHGEGLALLGLGIISRNRKDWDTAEEQLRTAAGILTTSGDRRMSAQASRSLAIVLCAKGEHAEAEQRFTAAGTEFRDLGDRRAAAYNDRGLADLYRVTGEADKALASYRSSLAGTQLLGDRRGQAWALLGIARISALQGDPDYARDRLREALALVENIGDHVLDETLHAALAEVS